MMPVYRTKQSCLQNKQRIHKLINELWRAADENRGDESSETETKQEFGH